MDIAKPTTIEQYLKTVAADARAQLQQVRAAIKEAAPDATEAISYAIPTFKLGGKNLVHFAAFKNHIGFYAAPTGHEAFKDDLSIYKQGKGSVQFPLSEPMPLALIKKIVEFRIKELLKK